MGYNSHYHPRWESEEIQHFYTKPICNKLKQSKKNKNYQPMPSTKTNSFLNDALKSNENRFGSIITSNDNFGMARQHRELLFATVPTALQVRETAIDGTRHSLNHFGGWKFKMGKNRVRKDQRWKAKIIRSKLKAMQWRNLGDFAEWEKNRRESESVGLKEWKKGENREGKRQKFLFMVVVVVMLWIPDDPSTTNESVTRKRDVCDYHALGGGGAGLRHDGLSQYHRWFLFSSSGCAFPYLRVDLLTFAVTHYYSYSFTKLPLLLSFFKKNNLNLRKNYTKTHRIY